MALKQKHHDKEFGRGVAFGVIAYCWWGIVVTLYVKALDHVPALELVGHRVVWSLVVTAVVLTFIRGWRRLARALDSRSTRLLLLGSTSVVAVNWFVFIWAIYTERVSQASLGYYINPLVSVLFGFLFLKERLRPAQKLSIGIAAMAVLYLTVRLGELPWVSLALAVSFGLYGLFRKLAPVSPVGGLFVETTLLALIFVPWMFVMESGGELSFLHDGIGNALLLSLAGIVTATPLMLFSGSARRLPLATLGIMQYIAPSLQLILAVVFFGEAFSIHHAFSFGAIWTALGIYTWDTIRARSGVAG